MRRFLRYFLICVLVMCLPVIVTAQTTQAHLVQAQETIYGIARAYGITVEQLMQANPEMKQPGYQLKTGTTIQVPVRQPGIRLGVMLPLHQINNDGKRMVEYYRGVLMACDSLKKVGISVDVYAWNLPETADINPILQDPNAARCDIILGPLYSRFVEPLSNFAAQHDILLAIPFSIQAPQLYENRHIFQVFQTSAELTESTARRCADWFKGYHPIIVDCADSTSNKGKFTAAFRRQLEEKDIQYSLTSLKSSEMDFSKAFVKDRPNLVVLNTSRSPELLSAFGRLSTVKATTPNIQIAMFGYTEWMMYTQYQMENFYKNNVYIPAPFYTNLQSPQTDHLMRLYRRHFNQDMIIAMPRFALTGFDHAMFFLHGIKKYGKAFDGTAGSLDWQPVQTPLKFERIGNGGLQNRAFMFIHYKDDHSVETLNY